MDIPDIPNIKTFFPKTSETQCKIQKNKKAASKIEHNILLITFFSHYRPCYYYYIAIGCNKLGSKFSAV